MYMSVTQLSDRVRRELTYLSYPPREWTVPRGRDGVPVLDVLIVGGGQSGLGTAFGLKLERITNIRIVDRSRRGLEGPWRRFARMKELRTPKEVAGIDFGIPSLTARAWMSRNMAAGHGSASTESLRKYGDRISIGTATFSTLSSKTRLS
jgi:cation diffusion facilitator CzcD-associated flavoprotein CzcO